MSLENEVDKESIILLPRFISPGRAEKFLYYLVRKLPANISYNFPYDISLTHTGLPGFKKLKKWQNTKRIEVRLHISEGLSTDFNIEPADRDSQRLGSIKFNTKADDKLSDYQPEVINLWHEVRRLTDRYFGL